jgi:hypothetical protein
MKRKRNRSGLISTISDIRHLTLFFFQNHHSATLQGRGGRRHQADDRINAWGIAFVPGLSLHNNLSHLSSPPLHLLATILRSRYPPIRSITTEPKLPIRSTPRSSKIAVIHIRPPRITTSRCTTIRVYRAHIRLDLRDLQLSGFQKASKSREARRFQLSLDYQPSRGLLPSILWK